MRLLILGGSAEASALALRLAERNDVAAILSLAGRTRAPAASPLPVRIGGFGGAAGLADYLRGNRIDAVIDATHPFAAQISANAVQACQSVGTPLAVLTRPPWRPEPKDRWTAVGDVVEAAAALGREPRRVFLTIGSRGLDAFAAAPHHHYLIRAIEPPPDLQAIPDHALLLARGPFRIEDETALMRNEGIGALVAKNSGGRMTEAKLQAARALGVEMIMIDPPERQETTCFHDLEPALDWLERHRARP